MYTGLSNLGLSGYHSQYSELKEQAIAAARRNNASLWFAGAPADLAGFVWQDSAGTTPATGTDPIGLMLDRQYGANNLGPNIRPALNTWTPYVGSATPTATGFDITTSGGNGGVFVNAATVSGKTYRFQAILRRGTTNAVALKTAFGTIGTTTSLTDVLVSGVFTASGATTALNIENGATPGTSFASSVSLVEVLGIPALQATAANKPTLLQNSAGYFDAVFDVTNDTLSAALPSGGSPAVVSFTDTGEVTGFVSATTSGFVIGNPTVGGRKVGVIVASATALPAADLAAIRTFAGVVRGAPYP